MPLWPGPIARYCTNNCRNCARISTRCWMQNRPSYGVLFVDIFQIIDRVITAPRGICLFAPLSVCSVSPLFRPWFDESSPELVVSTPTTHWSEIVIEMGLLYLELQYEFKQFEVEMWHVRFRFRARFSEFIPLMDNETYQWKLGRLTQSQPSFL